MFRNPNLDMSVHGSRIHVQVGNYPQEPGQIIRPCKRILLKGERNGPLAQHRVRTSITLRKEGYQSTHCGVLLMGNSRTGKTLRELQSEGQLPMDVGD